MKTVHAFKQFIFIAFMAALLFSCNKENGKLIAVPDTDLPIMTFTVSPDETSTEFFLDLVANETETPRIEIDLGDGHFQLLKDADTVHKNVYLLKGKTVRIKGKIEEVSCSVNGLSAVDVSKNVVLKSFYCDNNFISQLDVSQNAALTTLYCTNNRLIGLDFSKNTKISSIICNINKISIERMTRLAYSLPKANPKTKKESPVIYLHSDIKEEENKVSDELVTIIKNKNWRVYFFNKNGESFEL